MKKPKTSQNNYQDWDSYWQEHKPVPLAPQEEDWYNLVWRVNLEYWEEVADRFSQGKKVLECGAGSAKVSAHLASKGYRCTMLDNSLAGLKAGKSAFERVQLEGDFLQGDVENMGLKDATYDMVYSGGLLEHFADIRPAIKEMVRVLKPGGLFAATVIPRRFSCQALADGIAFLGKFLLHLVTLRFRGSVKESRRNFPFYENSLSLREYRKVLEESGLEKVVATGTSPFPALPLPRFLRSSYVWMMRQMLPCWRKFDRSPSKPTEIWGATYSLYGIKRSR